MDNFNLTFTISLISIFLGATIGSFLNVCIYRMPREISVNKPRRSFCTSCKKLIPFYFNIPIFSWFFLRGKCAFCKAKFSFRYSFIEFLTALLFLFTWLSFGFPQAPVFWLFICLLIVAFFIDLDFMIIPDSITIGGTFLGIFLSTLVPSIHSESIWYLGLYKGILGASVGFATIYSVLLLGKLAFGKKKVKYDTFKSWDIKERKIDGGEYPVFKIDNEKLAWHDLFYRSKDVLVLTSNFLKIDGKVIFDNRKKSMKDSKYQNVYIYQTCLKVNDQKWDLEKLNLIQGSSDTVTIPREAMGFGDVKFVAAIGAFLGFQSVFFCLIVGSFSGVLTALVGLIFKKDVSRIPFGPHLAIGAIIWLFYGDRLISYYLNSF